MTQRFLSDLDSAGKKLAMVKQAGGKLTTDESKQISNVLRFAGVAFARRAQANKTALAKALQRRLAIYRSAKEGLLTEDAGKKEMTDVLAAIAQLNTSKAQLDKGVMALKQLESMQKELVAVAPELDKLDKGHQSSDSIKDPEQPAAPPKTEVKASTEGKTVASANARARVLISQAIKLQEAAAKETDATRKKELENKASLYEKMADKLAPEIIKDMDMGTDKKEPAAPAIPKGLEKKEPMAPAAPMPAELKENAQQVAKEVGKEIAKEVAKEVVQEIKEPGKKEPGKKEPEKKEPEKKEPENKEPEKKEPEKDEKALASKRVADIRARIAAKREAAKASIEIQANEKVLLPDGSIGIVSALNGDKVRVSVGGVEKELLASTIKRIAAEQTVTPADDKSAVVNKGGTTDAPAEVTDKGGTQKEKSDVVAKASITSRVRDAVKIMREGGKKTAADEAAPAMSPETKKEPAAPAAGPGETAVKSETTMIGVNDAGKFTVTTVQNEVKEFPTPEEARAFINKIGSNNVKAIYTYQSEDPTEPEGSEGVASKLKGLDQKGKDYGTTAKEEQVNPTMSVAKAGKEVQGTAMNPGLPTDSTTAKAPDSSEGVASKLRGLDMAGKDAGATTAEQKINPQLSIYAKKLEITAAHNKKLAGELAVYKAKDVVARALKVGAITEGQVEEQRTVLAELYANSPAEFNAFERLIANMETNSTTASVVERLTTRQNRKVEASLGNRQQALVDASEGSEASGSLDNGTFFEE